MKTATPSAPRPVRARPPAARATRTRREQHRFTRVLARAAGTGSALHPFRAHLWVRTSGRHGSLSVSARRVRGAANRLTRLGLLEGVARDPFVVEPESTTTGLARDYLCRETARVVQRVSRVQADLRSAALRGVRLPWPSWWLDVALITVVLGVDTLLNTPLVERLAGVGQLLALLASFSVSILLLLVSHLAVAGTPRGQRHRARRTLVVVLLLGFTGFVVAGGYLRTHSADSGRHASLGLSGAEQGSSWTDLLGPVAAYATMLGLLVTTFAAASLADLYHQQRLDQLRDDDNGTWALTIEVRCEQVVRDGLAAIGQLEATVDQLVTVHTAGYRCGLPADVADRLAHQESR